ncbi:hypothetical protein B0F90DRAFT_851221 [Multifurca ochricompacta]|uniref:Uncharacterized protein n=1 Tax=Multifurca ochricompacta TaxID=376703 RepID=A0AAD4QM24_9AGAM|nr:hypothetical protein B0F90DRAFT_851221 [Multifurca ochricompacta]
MSSANKFMLPPPLPMATIEYKKDGTVSRMRSHRGNIPQLPQTKLCPFCPAKFTRTTHLNRHLRTHTNERLYRCEVCSAQFTRSDLLARHKRSCGESHPISRSRKRSCQACTNLKVKCDLHQPCSKCRARGRDCVYASEEGQGESAADSSGLQQFPTSRTSGPLLSLDASAGFYPSTFGLGVADASATAFPELSLIEETSNAISQPLSEANLASFMAGAPRISQGAMSLPTNDRGSDATASSFRRLAPNHAYTAFGASEVAGHSRGLHGFSSTMFEPFFRDVFSVKEETSHHIEHESAPLLHAPESGTLVDQFSQSDFTQTFPDGTQVLDIHMNSSLMLDLLMNTRSDNHAPPLIQKHPPAAIPAPSPLPAPPPVPNSQPMYPSTLIYDPTKPPLYTKQDMERFLPLPRPTDYGPADPTTEELQQYRKLSFASTCCQCFRCLSPCLIVYVFLTAFLPQIPLVHTQTLRFELKPPMLLRAMQACGALFIKTPVAQAFVEKTLGTSRELLIHEFAKPSPEPKHQIHVIVTLILLQMIGLFHQDPQQRAASNIYHGMLVLVRWVIRFFCLRNLTISKMIRQNRLIERSAAWKYQTFLTTDPAILDATWRDWAVHEAIKRVICLAYCHDQGHRIYFSLPPSFSPSEFTMCLPCDDELWAAKTSLEWSQLLLSPSPYGSVMERLHGMPMHRAFAAVGLEGPNMTATLTASPEPPEELSAVSPFGHFILMQTLLGELFRRCSGAESPAANVSPGREEEVNEDVYAMQLALHRWLQMWLKTPNVPCSNMNGAEGGDKTTGRFMADPLPFYWLAQLLLVAFQENLPPFRTRAASPALTPASVSISMSTSESPNAHGLHEPSPFAPPVSSPSPSPFSPSPFAPSPFSSSSLSSGSSPPMMSLTPPPAYMSLSSGHTPPGMYYSSSNRGLGRVGGVKATPDAAQFRLIKTWLHHIRQFLRRSQGSPTVVWGELMKIRLCGWQEDAASSQLQQQQQQQQQLQQQQQRQRQHRVGSESEGEGEGSSARKKKIGDEGGGSDEDGDDSGSWLEGNGLIGFFEEKMRI